MNSINIDLRRITYVILNFVRSGFVCVVCVQQLHNGSANRMCVRMCMISVFAQTEME